MLIQEQLVRLVLAHLGNNIGLDLIKRLAGLWLNTKQLDDVIAKLALHYRREITGFLQGKCSLFKFRIHDPFFEPIQLPTLARRQLVG